MACGGEGIASKEEATVAIEDGKGVAVDAITGLEVALEVGGPDAIGLKHRSGGAARVTETPSATAGAREAVAFENLTDSGGCRPGEIGLTSLEIGDKLAGPPGRVLATEIKQGVGNSERG